MNNRAVLTMAVFALTAATLLTVFAATAAAETPAEKPKPAIELGAPFADNAILQRQMPVPIWGWSKPGTKVTVEFAGRKKTATAGKDRKWMVALDPLEASFEPREMVITEGTGDQRTLKNILVGEVWMASGQSNMQWIVGKCNVGRVLVKQFAERIKAGKEERPVIREGKVTNVFSALHPIEHAEGAWSDGSGFNDYSAIAFAFACKIYRELEVPVGILNCAFSTTKIEAWVPRVGFKGGKDEHTRSVYQKILETDPTTPEHKAAWNKWYADIENALKEDAERIKNGEPAKGISTRTPGNLGGNRDASWMFNGKLNPTIPYAIRGAVWNQGYASMGQGITYYNNLHSLVRGWRKRWNKPELPVYFHQFYCPGVSELPGIGSTAEMRLGTWLARDIPNAEMASQIDITGAVHYYNKTVPGRRLARHALKNQYGKDIVANGPMFKSYKVKGEKLIVEFEHADGGLVVAETGSNRKGIANPTIIENGDDQVKLCYLADKDRIWYPARVKIAGDKVILTSLKVKKPRGVSYATGGVGWQPNLYNKALLPMTPFIYYDHELVLSKTWPDEKLKIDGVEPDPETMGKRYEYRKMPLLSAQFRDNAVLQAGEPVTIWGSAVHNWGYEAEGEAVITFRFAGIEKTIPVKHGMKEWQVTLPPMEASAEPKTLKVTFTIDGELVHERVAENIVIGDVWYVAAPPIHHSLSTDDTPDSLVRVMTRKAKRSTSHYPSRFSVCVSTTPKNRFASLWTEKRLSNDGNGLAQWIGSRIRARTKKPVGILFMQSRDPELKYWIPFEDLKKAPSLMEDYKDLAVKHPGNPYYNANVRRYVADWKKYWREYIPEMMATKRVPDGKAWGWYPRLTSSVTSRASQTYNCMTHCFTPAGFKGIIFFCGKNMFEKDRGANYGPELSVLANGWKERFACPDPHFFYTIPSKALAPKITRPGGIKGRSAPYEIDHWLAAERGDGDEEDMAAVNSQLQRLVNQALDEAYQ